MSYRIEFVGGPVDGTTEDIENLFETLIFRNEDFQHVYALVRCRCCGDLVGTSSGSIQYRYVPELVQKVH